MPNNETNLAAAKLAAERAQARAALPESEREAYDRMIAAVDAPPAADGPPAETPIPGMGDAPGGVPTYRPVQVTPAPLTPEERRGDPLDIETRAHAFEGVAVAEMAALAEAQEEYDDFRYEHEHLLRDSWIEDATQREARDVAKYIDAGQEPPAARVSLVEEAMKARPLALAKLRALGRAVREADRRAVEAINRELPEALPRVQADLHAALDEVEAAVSAMSAAAAEVQRLHGVYVPMARKVHRPLPSTSAAWGRTLLDLHAARFEIEEALRNARARVPKTKPADDADAE